MSFEQLPQALDEGQALAPLTAEELAAEQEQLADTAALKLVLQDVTVAEKYVGSKALPFEWNAIEDLYRAWAPAQVWSGSNKPKAALSMPLILEAIENMLSQIHMAFFSDPQPFGLEAAGKTKPEAARAMAKVLCWSLKQARAKEEVRKMVKSTLQYGQCAGKWGWQVAEHNKDSYAVDKETGKVAKVSEPHEVARPTFEYTELRNILVDPSLRNHDIRNARFVVCQAFFTPEELDEMRDDYKNIPSLEEMGRLIVQQSEPATDSMSGNKAETYRAYQAEKQDTVFSANPLNQPLEVLEHWTDGRVVTVLQRKIIIRNEANELGRLPFLSCAFIDALGAWYGFGVSRLLGGEQQFQTGVANRMIDGLDLELSPMFHRKKGIGTTAQNIESAPGKVINDEGELTPIQVSSNSAVALEAIAASEARANRRVGANFGQEMPNQAMRTAEGVNSFTSGVQTRLQYFIENFADLVYIPMLEAFVQLAKDNLQPEQINAILSAEDGKAYQGDALEIYNGQYALEVLSSTKLAARRAMVALLPQLINLFTADPVQQSMLAQGKKVDFAELVQEAIDLTGWPAQGLIVDATPEDIQRAMQLNPGVQAAQAKSQQIDQKHSNDMELEQQKGVARAGNQVVKHILEGAGGDVPAAAAAPLANLEQPMPQVQPTPGASQVQGPPNGPAR